MLDVDGTVAPIAPTPAGAVVPETTRDTLRRLVALPGVAVALVSGRSATDAWALAGVPGAWVIGNHGFELRNPDGRMDDAGPAAPYRDAIKTAAERLRECESRIHGALVEYKGWTISFHYRLVAPEQVDRVIDCAHEVAHSLGLRITEGKKIAELRPPLDINKGTATVELAGRFGALNRDGSVLYAGDDRTDEDAFRELRARSPRAVTVHVASSDEQLNPPTQAEITLPSTAELREALDWIASRRSARR